MTQCAYGQDNKICQNGFPVGIVASENNGVNGCYCACAPGFEGANCEKTCSNGVCQAKCTTEDKEMLVKMELLLGFLTQITNHQIVAATAKTLISAV